MSEGGENLTFRDAFSSEPPARYASTRHDDSEDEFETDSEDGANNKLPQSAAAAPAAQGQAAKPDPSPAGPSAVEKALESGLWKKQLDQSSGKHYFYNVLTRETTWDLAKTLAATETPASAKSGQGMSMFDANASLGSLDDVRSKVPALQLENSFAAGSDVAVLQLPSAVLESMKDTPLFPTSGRLATTTTATTAAAKGDGAENRKPSVKSIGSDDVEDDEVARAKILARGGRIPIETSFRTAGMDLFNQVSTFKAFERSSASDGESAVSGGLPAAAMPAAAERPTAAPASTKAGGENPVPQAAQRRRPVFESDSSDFSTASQAIEKTRVAAAAAAQQTTTIAGPSAQLDATARPVPERSAPIETVSQPTATANDITSTHLNSNTSAWRPISEQPYVPPLPSHVASSLGVSRAAETPMIDASAAARFGRDSAISPAGVPIPQTNNTVLLAPSGGQMTSVSSSPHLMAPQFVVSGSSAVKEHGEALDHLVRAYTQLRGVAAPPDSSSKRNPDARLADLIAKALARKDVADDDSDDEDVFNEDDPVATHRSIHTRSSRPKVAHLVQRHQDATRYARWGNATTSLLRPQPTSTSHSKSRRAGASLIEQDANEKLDDCILNVVLSLFMERGGASVETQGRAPGAPSRRRPPSQPPQQVLTPEEYLAGATAVPLDRPSHTNLNVAPDAFRDPDGLRDAMETAFDKYVIALMRRSRRDWGPENTLAICRVARVALLDLSNALQDIVTSSLQLNKGTLSTSLPPSFAALRVELAPQGSPNAADLQSRIVYNIMNCLPVELLIDEGLAAAETSTGKRSSKFRFEYWVTAVHCLEMLKACTVLTRRLEVFTQDSYAAFDTQREVPTVDASDALLVVPEKPLVTALLTKGGDKTDDGSNMQQRQASSAPAARQQGAGDDPSLLGRQYQDLDTAEQILFVASKLIDEIAAEVSSSEGPTSSLQRAQRYRLESEVAVANTLEEFFAEVGIRSALKRRASAVVKKVMASNPNAALLEHTQNKVNRMVERLKYELELA